MKILSLFWYFIRELVFTNGDEYNPASRKFNMKKVALAAVLMLSLLMNVYVVKQGYRIGKENLELKKQISALKVVDPKAKNKPKTDPL